MNQIRRGSGKPLLLLHGLGGSWRSWRPILDDLAAERQVIAVDLPGFGKTPALDGRTTIATLAAAVTAFLDSHDLLGVDVAGSSMGARLALELARQGVVGSTVALDPGGFWSGWQRHFFYSSVACSVWLVRLLQPAMPMLTSNAVGRTLLLSQFSARPWRLSPEVVLEEMRSYASSPALDELLFELAYGAEQEGLASSSARAPITIGWGRQDRVCLPSQSARALELFPDASMHWFENCGHFPQWDVPGEAADLILSSTRGAAAVYGYQVELAGR